MRSPLQHFEDNLAQMGNLSIFYSDGRYSWTLRNGDAVSYSKKELNRIDRRIAPLLDGLNHANKVLVLKTSLAFWKEPSMFRLNERSGATSTKIALHEITAVHAVDQTERVCNCRTSSYKLDKLVGGPEFAWVYRPAKMMKLAFDTIEQYSPGAVVRITTAFDLGLDPEEIAQSAFMSETTVRDVTLPDTLALN